MKKLLLLIVASVQLQCFCSDPGPRDRYEPTMREPFGSDSTSFGGGGGGSGEGSLSEDEFLTVETSDRKMVNIPNDIAAQFALLRGRADFIALTDKTSIDASMLKALIRSASGDRGISYEPRRLQLLLTAANYFGMEPKATLPLREQTFNLAIRNMIGPEDVENGYNFYVKGGDVTWDDPSFHSPNPYYIACRKDGTVVTVAGRYPCITLRHRLSPVRISCSFPCSSLNSATFRHQGHRVRALVDVKKYGKETFTLTRSDDGKKPFVHKIRWDAANTIVDSEDDMCTAIQHRDLALRWESPYTPPIKESDNIDTYIKKGSEEKEEEGFATLHQIRQYENFFTRKEGRPPTAIAIANDGTVTTGTKEGTIRIYHPPFEICTHEYRLDGPVKAIEFGPGGTMIFATTNQLWIKTKNEQPYCVFHQKGSPITAVTPLDVPGEYLVVFKNGRSSFIAIPKLFSSKKQVDFLNRHGRQFLELEIEEERRKKEERRRREHAAHWLHKRIGRFGVYP